MRIVMHQPPGFLGVLRVALLAGVALFYAAAILDRPDWIAAGLGFSPVLWIALEAVWRMFAPQREGDRE